MATDPYDEILKRVKRLTRDEQEKLMNDLARDSNGSGNSGGKTVGECLKARDLLGVAKDGRADLSTNPKYMGEGKTEQNDLFDFCGDFVSFPEVRSRERLGED